jgi:penicillin G amidase
LMAAGVVAFLYGRAVLPPHDGELTLPGLRAEVRIERDRHGIPTIHASNAEDLAFGLGVAHAQDRLWQLETHRRIGAGRLAEAFGEPALDNDRFLRALGVRRAAAAQWARTRGESRAALEAYAAGVNAWVRGHLKARPPEFLILGLQPEDWTPVDSLAWAIMMAWDLGGNWSTELLRLRLALGLPVERINQLMPPYPGEPPLATQDYAALYRGLNLQTTGLRSAALARLLAAAPPSGIEGTGSNNWVLAGSHTTTGKPLLANDPHLKLTTPALWYFARLKAPGIDVGGATMPGLPTVVLGQNSRVAWGFTNTGPDVQDLFLERVKPGDATQYQTPDGWAAFETGTETIRVKGKPDVTMTVRRSRHGPVISDAGNADDTLGARERQGYVLAMRWTALDEDADPMGQGLSAHRARSVDEFIAGTSGWVAPMQNMVVADVDGRIGLVLPGRIPVRKPDNQLKGLAPAPGWDARYDWDGHVPFDALHQERDPARGWIATANQRTVPAGYVPFLTSEWAAPYRQQRIEQLLQSRPKHSLDDLRAMQADEKSLAAPVILPWLLKSKSDHPLAAAAMQQLAGFDGTMAADRAAPLIFWAWARQLTQAVFADEMGPLYERTLGNRTFRDALEGVLARDDAWWCDDKTTPAAEACASRVDLAFTRALDELHAAQGADVAAWQWGRAHQARSEHRPFSKVKPLARWFELRTPTGGDTFTVNVSRVSFRPDATTGELYLNEHGPSLRALYDLADRSRSQVMHSSGQSGIPWSPQYGSFVRPWAEVGYVPLWPAEAPATTLRLRPGP